MIETKPVAKIWNLMRSVIQEFWAITEPAIEKAAVSRGVPFELFLYSEHGLNYFSLADFQKRDPFTNPDQFEKVFAQLNVKGWIEPQPDERYKVTDKARAGVLQVIADGYAYLPSALTMPEIDLERLKVLIKQIVLANNEALEPPEKWAIFRRFRSADSDSPVLVKIYEYLMDLLAYHEDSHLAAARPHFNQAGIVWNVLGAAAGGNIVTAVNLAEKLSFRGYDANDYEIALQAAKEIGWLEDANDPESFRLSQMGNELRTQVEHQTGLFFYTPWAVLTEQELDEVYGLLIKLRERLREIRKNP